MKTIQLNILAEDFRTSDFTNSKDCVITRAIKRLNLSGVDIHSNWLHCKGETVHYPGELMLKVRRMYSHLDINGVLHHWGEDVVQLGTLEPQDFTFDLEVPDNW